MFELKVERNDMNVTQSETSFRGASRESRHST